MPPIRGSREERIEQLRQRISQEVSRGLPYTRAESLIRADVKGTVRLDEIYPEAERLARMDRRNRAARERGLAQRERNRIKNETRQRARDLVGAGVAVEVIAPEALSAEVQDSDHRVYRIDWKHPKDNEQRESVVRVIANDRMSPEEQASRVAWAIAEGEGIEAETDRPDFIAIYNQVLTSIRGGMVSSAQDRAEQIHRR